MAAPKSGSKRKRNRKARTEISSSSESSSVNTSRESSVAPVTTKVKTQQELESFPVDSPKRLTVVDPKQAFEDFYLRQATKEFGDDLVKLRNANDFSASSVEVLIAGLRQGTACFKDDEKVRIARAETVESGEK